MNISEALRRIKKIKGEMSKEQGRMNSYVSWRVDQKPVYSFLESRESLEKLSEELVVLEAKVAEKNATSKIKFENVEMSLAQVIRTLQEIKSMISIYEGLVINNSEQVTKERFYSESEEKYITEKVTIKFESAITERDKDNKISQLKDKFEKLNSLLEDANHKVVL